MNPLWQIVLGPCAAFFVAVGVVLLVTALVGRPRGTRPRCGTCRAALRGHVTVPSTCPSCSASLAVPGAVRFGGYRLRGRLLLVGIALLALPMIGGAINAFGRAATPVMVPFGTIPIERRPSAARFAEATANGDEGAWLWIKAHLEAGELSPDLERAAADLLIESTRRGIVGADIERAAALLESLVEERVLAEAMLDAVPEPRVVTERLRGDAIVLRIEWDDEAALTRSDGLRLQRVYALVDMRVDGVSRRPTSPGGRVRRMPRSLVNFLPARPQDADSPPRSITVELAMVVVADPASEQQFSGRPETWPGVMAHRRVVLEVPVTGGPAPAPPATGAPATGAPEGAGSE